MQNSIDPARLGEIGVRKTGDFSLSADRLRRDILLNTFSILEPDVGKPADGFFKKAGGKTKK
jgi:hypothetical protein